MLGRLQGDSRRGQTLNPHIPVPPKALALLWAPGAEIKSLDAEQGHKGAGTEGAGCVEVGVIRCPASHNLLIVYQRVTGAAQRAARQQNLQARRSQEASPTWPAGSEAEALSQTPLTSKFQPSLLPPPPRSCL